MTIERQELFDYNSLESDVDQEVILILIKMFVSDTNTLVPKLREAIRKSDAERARTLIHMMKGCCRSIIAVPVERFCETLEDAAAQSDWNALVLGVDKLELVYAQLAAEVAAYLKFKTGEHNSGNPH
jgi:HPt (histidine-containing phosphotransfer) domain-containing protein